MQRFGDGDTEAKRQAPVGQGSTCSLKTGRWRTGSSRRPGPLWATVARPSASGPQSRTDDTKARAPGATYRISVPFSRHVLRVADLRANCRRPDFHLPDMGAQALPSAEASVSISPEVGGRGENDNSAASGEGWGGRRARSTPRAVECSAPRPWTRGRPAGSMARPQNSTPCAAS